MTTDELINAKYPEDVFGDRWAEIRPRWRELTKQFHPDHGGDEEAFKRLGELYKLAQKAFDNGVYGKRVTTDAVLITTKRHAYTVTRLRCKGATSLVYDATYQEGDDTANATLKVIRDPAQGTKLQNEAQALKSILQWDPEFHDLVSFYLPSYIEAFGYKHNGKRRQAIAYKAKYPVFSLVEVQRAYPSGVHPKDSAWMLRRILMALGYVHASGWVHHQVDERHIMIQPEEHGLMLVDWTQATQEKWDPKIAGQDVAEALRSIRNITAMDMAPRRYIRFIDGCLRYPQRLPDAWTLKDEYDELIEDLWGPRRFRPFHMPKQ